MLRRRSTSDLVVVDLVTTGGDGATAGAPAEPPDDGADDAAADGPRGRGATPPGHRTPAQARRQAIAAGAVLVVALGGWGVTTAVRAHERTARISSAPGGVLSLEHRPAQAWSAPTDGADAWAFLPGVVAVRDGAQLVGLDAATGTERWRAEVGGDPSCGPVAWGRAGPGVADRITCWTGPNGERSAVTVVDRNGLVATRDLEPDLAAVAPGPDGTLVTVRRVGPAAPPPDVVVDGDASLGWHVTGSLPEGQDAVVRLEDAATGEPLWERDVAFRPVEDVTTCATMTMDPGTGQATANVTSLSLAANEDLVELIGCGLRSGFAADGTPVTDPTLSSWSDVQPYVDGGVVEHVGGYRPDTAVVAVLHTADGGLETFDSELIEPWATDGVPSDVRLVGGFTRRLRALAPDGTELWHTVDLVPDVLVRAGGVLLVARVDGSAAGLDLATGATLWADERLLLSGDGGDGWWGASDVVRSAFTDGERALLVVQFADQPGLTLIAVDLATGEVLWRDSRPDGDSRLVAAGGRLYEVHDDARADGIWLREEAGQLVRHADGEVRALR